MIEYREVLPCQTITIILTKAVPAAILTTIPMTTAIPAVAAMITGNIITKNPAAAAITTSITTMPIPTVAGSRPSIFWKISAVPTAPPGWRKP